MIKCKEINLGLKQHDGSSKIYDIIWGNKSSGGLNKNRRGELLKVLSPVEVMYALLDANLSWVGPEMSTALEEWSKNFPGIKNKAVVDFGAGRGAYSTAAAELGANSVLMLEGSKSAIQTYEKRLQNTKNLIIPAKEIAEVVTKCHIDLNRPEEFFEKNGKHFADFVFSRYMIMHSQNPFIAIYNMTRMLKPGGIVCFNTYLPASVSTLTRHERTHMICLPWETKINLLSALGKIKKADMQFTIKEFFSGAGPHEFDDIRKFYVDQILPNYSMEEIEKTCFHVEDSTTPYLHTPSADQIEFMCALLELQPVSDRGGGIGLVDNNHHATEFWGSFRTTEKTLKVSIDQIPKIELLASRNSFQE
jgi:SAM-dependent methyltransferase